MYPIPRTNTVERQRLIDEHRACIDDMKGVAGCSILRTERPGSAIGAHGGIHEHKDLANVLVRMRGQNPRAYGGKLITICVEPERAWRIGRLSGIRGVPPTFVDERVFNDENEIQHAIFLMRLDQYPETDGMPEDFHEGWKRHDDSWAAT